MRRSASESKIAEIALTRFSGGTIADGGTGGIPRHHQHHVCSADRRAQTRWSETPAAQRCTQRPTGA
eukprot:1474361-Pleurochrysis_carterae.AAC.1